MHIIVENKLLCIDTTKKPQKRETARSTGTFRKRYILAAEKNDDREKNKSNGAPGGTSHSTVSQSPTVSPGLFSSGSGIDPDYRGRDSSSGRTGICGACCHRFGIARGIARGDGRSHRHRRPRVRHDPRVRRHGSSQHAP